MPTNDAAVRVDDLSGAGSAAATANEFGMVAAGDETDFLAVRFVGDAQAQFGRGRPNVALAAVADRQQHPGEQFRRDSEEDV